MLETPNRQDPIRLATDNEHEVLSWSAAITASRPGARQCAASGIANTAQILRGNLRDEDSLRPPGIKRGTISYLSEVCIRTLDFNRGQLLSCFMDHLNM